jgi:hypothetical protein
MIAVSDIDKDEILARIPKSSILEPSTSAIKEMLLKSETEFLNNLISNNNNNFNDKKIRQERTEKQEQLVETSGRFNARAEQSRIEMVNLSETVSRLFSI